MGTSAVNTDAGSPLQGQLYHKEKSMTTPKDLACPHCRGTGVTPRTCESPICGALYFYSPCKKGWKRWRLQRYCNNECKRQCTGRVPRLKLSTAEATIEQMAEEIRALRAASNGVEVSDNLD